jgi:hypothetical protein
MLAALIKNRRDVPLADVLMAAVFSALAWLAGADVDCNEIDERRRHLLSLQGFSPTAFDAERLDNLLPADQFYDAVVMRLPRWVCP